MRSGIGKTIRKLARVKVIRKLIPVLPRRTRKAAKTILLTRRIRRLDAINPSHAHELVARRIVIPIAKQVMGDWLAGVGLMGSAQRAFRIAQQNSRTSKASTSDLDVVLFLNKGYSFENYRKYHGRVMRKIWKEFQRKRIPFTADIVFHRLGASPEDLLPLRNSGYPVQIIYGKELERTLANSVPPEVRRKDERRSLELLADRDKYKEDPRRMDAVRKALEKLR